MKCPKCMRKTKVIESVTDNNKVLRCRKCTNCGEQFMTEENQVSYQPAHKIMALLRNKRAWELEKNKAINGYYNNKSE